MVSPNITLAVLKRPENQTLPFNQLTKFVNLLAFAFALKALIIYLMKQTGHRRSYHKIQL